MTVDPDKTPHRARHEGVDQFFCSAGCRTKFLADPRRYLEPGSVSVAVPPAGTIYTCPISPDARQIGPASCPICGMALEPELATSDAGPNPELYDMGRRFWTALVLTV